MNKSKTDLKTGKGKMMLNYEEIYKAICENYEKIKELGKSKDKSDEIYPNLDKLRDTNNALLNNARFVLYNETFPKVLEILKEFENKPLGEKTKQKLSEKTIEKLNVDISVREREIYIHFKSIDCFDLNSIYVSTVSTSKSINPILKDNRLQVYSFEDYRLNGSRGYIENVENYIQRITQLKKQAKEMREVLCELCKTYNNIIVDGMQEIYYVKW